MNVTHSKPRLWLSLTAILLSLALQSPAHCLESAEQVLKELDAYYYYPQKQGLQKLSVRVDLEQLDVFTDSGKYLKNPSLEFIWENSRAGVKSIFKLAEGSAAISSDRRQELLGMLENYKEIVVPETLSDKISGHTGQVKFTKKQNSLIEFVASDSSAVILKYGLLVDRERKNVRNIRLERKNAPDKIESDISYISKDGKWLIAESRSRFRVGEMKYQETTEYVYRRTGKFWLVGKMSQTLKVDDRVLQSFIFRFHDYKIN
jgi:uncharacterized beta-barrel protein YwiB (DUF1934 family)